MKQKQGKQKFKKSPNTLGAVDGIIYLTLTKNNTILTLTTLQGEVLSWTTCKNCGFQGGEKSTEIATITTAEEMGLRALDFKIKKVHLVFRGGGRFQRAALRGLIRSKIQVATLVVKTLVPYNGCRIKKSRRI